MPKRLPRPKRERTKRVKPAAWPPTHKCPGCGRQTGVSSDPAGRCFSCEDQDLVPIGGALVAVPRQKTMPVDQPKERS